MNGRPVIVGLNNPLSDEPKDALVPWPTGSTGDRVLELLVEALPHLTAAEYVAAFDRRNLWPMRELPVGEGRVEKLRHAGGKILRSLLQGPKPRAVILLGPLVWTSVLGTTSTPVWFDGSFDYGLSWLYMPHPSGRNRLFNRPEIRKRASTLLAMALEEWREAERARA